MELLCEEDREAIAKEIQEEKELEQQFPVLQKTEEGTEFFFEVHRQQRSHCEFINSIEQLPLKAALENWLHNLWGETKNSYAYHVTSLMKRGFFPVKDMISGKPYTVGHFNHVPHNLTIDYIKKIEDVSEATKQAYAACYISFTRWLNRITHGWFKPGEPGNETFFKIRDKCKTEAISDRDWHLFIIELEKINLRDALIAKCMRQGARRISEVLEVTLDQIDHEKRIIHFPQKKSGRTYLTRPITFCEEFWNDLTRYIEQTKDKRVETKTLFITNRGKRVYRTHINQAFKRACELAGVEKNITPHTLRATWVTEAKKRGYSDSDLMKVTGQSPTTLYAYDKTSAEENITKSMNLI